MADCESSGSVPRRKTRSKAASSLSCSELFLTLAFVAFAATTCFYTVQFVFVSICHLLDVVKFELAAFGVQVFPFWSVDKLPHLSYFSTNALPWGLAALAVFTGSKLLLVPIQICKIRLAYITISVAAMNWESTFKKQIVVLASIEGFELAFILLVFLVMACASHRPLYYYYFGTGSKVGLQQSKVRINMVRRAEEGEVDAMPRIGEAERFKSNMETLLLKKEEELVAARTAEQGIAANGGVTVETAAVEVPAESRGIYPVLGSPTSPV